MGCLKEVKQLVADTNYKNHFMMEIVSIVNYLMHGVLIQCME